MPTLTTTNSVVTGYDVTTEPALPLKAIFPNSLIIGSRPDLEIKLVTSAKTDEAFRTGQENDGINPFEKKENS